MGQANVSFNVKLTGYNSTETITIDEDPIQAVLGLPEVDRKETRRNLMKVFAVYRRWKRQIEDGEDLQITVVARKPLDGYQNAMDPDLIRSPSPSGGGFSTEDPHTRRVRRFISTVDRTVRNLPMTQSILIKERYMSLITPLPRDLDVFLSMQERRLLFSEREYDREKAEAMMALGDALKVTVFRIPD